MIPAMVGRSKRRSPVNVNGAVALVTGAGSGLGRAIAEALARRGARIAVHYHDSIEGARSVVEDAGGSPRALAIRADLRSPPDIMALLDQTVERFGRVDLLVNNAAVLVRTPVEELDAPAWDAIHALNLRAPALLASWAGERMRRSGGGVIVNIGDLAGIEPWPAYLAHATAKAGLHHLTRCLALALAPAVRVNAVAPGLVDPPPGWSEERIQRFRRRVPGGRLPSPAEVVHTVLALIENDAVTGQVLVVDGGQTLSF